MGSAGSPQIAATLLDLAGRGHITIWYTHLDSGRPRTVEDILFEQVPDAADPVTDVEAELLERVFSHGDCVAVDTLRRLARRWPVDLADRLSEKVSDFAPSEPEPEPEPVHDRASSRERRTLAVVAGLFTLVGLIAVTALTAIGVLRDAGPFAVAVVLVLLGGLIADRASKRRRPVVARRVTTRGQRLVAYRFRLRRMIEGRDVRTPGDCERVLGEHHAWAIALEVVPDWLALPESRTDPWAGINQVYGVRAVWVRRARPIPVSRNPVSLRIAHRIPAPRKPRE